MYRHVIRFNSKIPSVAGQYEKLSNIVFGDSKKDAVSNNVFADNFVQLSKDLNVPLKLAAVGIKHSDISKLAEEAMKQTRLLPNNPREVTLNDAIELYQAAL